MNMNMWDGSMWEENEDKKKSQKMGVTEDEQQGALKRAEQINAFLTANESCVLKLRLPSAIQKKIATLVTSNKLNNLCVISETLRTMITFGVRILGSEQAENELKLAEVSKVEG